MKVSILFRLLLIILLSSASRITWAKQKPVLAILGFGTENIPAETAFEAAVLLRRALTSYDKFEIIEAAYIESILRANDHQPGDCITEECGIKAGVLLDADMIILGEFTRNDNQYILSARLMDLETGWSLINRTIYFETDDSATVLTYVPQIAEALAGELPLRASVKSISNTQEIVFETGGYGLAVGEILNVVRVVSRRQHPRTAEWIFESIDVGRVKVIRIDDAAAAAVPVSGDDFNINDVVYDGLEIRQASRLKVITKPAGAFIFLNGERQGIAPLTLRHISSGSHIITVSLKGFESRSEQIELKPGKQRKMKYNLRKLLLIKGSLQINSDPDTAIVYLDNVKIGETPLFVDNLAAGDHTVAIKLSGYTPYSDVIRVKKGQSSALDITLVKRGEERKKDDYKFSGFYSDLLSSYEHADERLFFNGAVTLAAMSFDQADVTEYSQQYIQYEAGLTLQWREKTIGVRNNESRYLIGIEYVHGGTKELDHNEMNILFGIHPGDIVGSLPIRYIGKFGGYWGSLNSLNFIRYNGVSFHHKLEAYVNLKSFMSLTGHIGFSTFGQERSNFDIRGGFFAGIGLCLLIPLL